MAYEKQKRSENQEEVNAVLVDFEEQWSKGNFDDAGKAYGKYWNQVRGKATDFEDISTTLEDDLTVTTKTDRNGDQTFEKRNMFGTLKQQGTRVYEDGSYVTDTFDQNGNFLNRKTESDIAEGVKLTVWVDALLDSTW